MKIASFTMFRNEEAMMAPFLDQLVEFFDDIYLVNHESTDKSVDIVKARGLSNLHLFHLKASGYPQSQLATEFVRRAFAETDADWLFFIDCDEFLPFRNRAELAKAIAAIGSHEILTLNWRNLLPEKLDGSNIFAGRFLALPEAGRIPKIVLSRKAFAKDPQLRVLQGYHAVGSSQRFDTASLSDAGLFHIPVQSKLRFGAKIKMSAERLIKGGQDLLSKGQGYHWLSYYRQIEAQGLDNFDFISAGLLYPDPPTETQTLAEPIDFTFDYVKSEFRERPESLFAQLFTEATAATGTDFYTLCDDKGEVISVDHKPSAPAVAKTGAPAAHAVRLIEDTFSEFYSALVEPLFALPLKLPKTAWAGHIPFLFVLFRLLRPRSYVDLGVHLGASLIAAATAAKSYQIPMRLYGVDTWEGDAHAGFYEGDRIYSELLTFSNQHFKNVELVRRTFDQACSLFVPGSVDVLHIDGLHTYDAVKHDFVTWLPKVSAGGVILMHDTCVHNEGFGVYRFFAELERQFTTIQFFQSHGLGVVILDDTLPALQPLVRVAKDPDLRRFYQALVSDIAGLLPDRMRYLESAAGGRQVGTAAEAPAGQTLNGAPAQETLDELAYYKGAVAAFQSEQKSFRALRRILP